jgi:cytochrome c-type biogenesis protein CcmH
MPLAGGLQAEAAGRAFENRSAAMRSRFLISSTLLALLAGAWAATAAEPPASEALEKQARALEGKLMAPCCFSQTVDQHESEVSREMRAEMRGWLTAGASEEQILDRYVERYGARILAVPPRQGFNQLLFWMPWVVTLGLLVAACLTLWGWYRRGQPPSPA